MAAVVGTGQAGAVTSRRPNPFAAALQDVGTVYVLVLGVWRVSQGRAPWQPAKRHR